jgi:hypothetical protein
MPRPAHLPQEYGASLSSARMSELGAGVPPRSHFASNFIKPVNHY